MRPHFSCPQSVWFLYYQKPFPNIEHNHFQINGIWYCTRIIMNYAACEVRFVTCSYATGATSVTHMVAYECSLVIANVLALCACAQTWCALDLLIHRHCQLLLIM